MNSAIWAEYAERYRATIRALACACDHVAKEAQRSGAGDDFSRALIEAHGLGLLREDGLADMGMVKRSTANRWINGAAKPSKLQQCVIMGKLAAHLRSVAREMANEALDIPSNRRM